MEEDLFSHRRSNITFIFLFFINVFLLTAHLTGYIRGFKSFLYYVLYPSPVAATMVMQFGQNLSQNITELVRIHQENLMLRKTAEKYYYLDNEYQRAVGENARLR